MEKIKRNIKIEIGVDFAKLMCLLNFQHPKDQVNELAKCYKESEWKDRTFDNKDVDLIIKALKKLPGYSSERFFATGAILGTTELEDEECIDYLLQIAYMYLSMVNPELFEEASDENHEV